MATPGRKRQDGAQPWRAHWRDERNKQRNKTFASEKAAVAWEEKMRRERDDRVLGINTAARDTKLNDWIVEWWDNHITTKPLNTRESYARLINGYVAPELGEMAMAELTTPRVAQFRDDLGQ